MGTDEEELQRRATRLWHERFASPRAASDRPRRTFGLARISLLVIAMLMAVLGLSLRGERIATVIGDAPTAAGDWPALLSRELALTDSSGALFFPAWEEWRRAQQTLVTERAALAARLEELSREHSQYNMEQDRLLGLVAALDSQEWRERRTLLERTRERLGLWQAARLRFLLETRRP